MTTSKMDPKWDHLNDSNNLTARKVVSSLVRSAQNAKAVDKTFLTDADATRKVLEKPVNSVHDAHSVKGRKPNRLHGTTKIGLVNTVGKFGGFYKENIMFHYPAHNLSSLTKRKQKALGVDSSIKIVTDVEKQSKVKGMTHKALTKHKTELVFPTPWDLTTQHWRFIVNSDGLFEMYHPGVKPEHKKHRIKYSVQHVGYFLGFTSFNARLNHYIERNPHVQDIYKIARMIKQDLLKSCKVKFGDNRMSALTFFKVLKASEWADKFVDEELIMTILSADTEDEVYEMLYRGSWARKTYYVFGEDRPAGVYASASKVAEALGISRHNVSNYADKNRKTRQGFYITTVDEIPDSLKDTYTPYLASQLALKPYNLCHEVGMITDNQMQALNETVVNGRTATETAEILGTSPNIVKIWIQTASQSLNMLLTDETNLDIEIEAEPLNMSMKNLFKDKPSLKNSTLGVFRGQPV